MRYDYDGHSKKVRLRLLLHAAVVMAANALLRCREKAQ